MRYNLSNVCRIIQLERSGWDKVYSHVSSVLSLCFSLSFSLSLSFQMGFLCAVLDVLALAL